MNLLSSRWRVPCHRFLYLVFWLTNRQCTPSPRQNHNRLTRGLQITNRQNPRPSTLRTNFKLQGLYFYLGPRWLSSQRRQTRKPYHPGQGWVGNTPAQTSSRFPSPLIQFFVAPLRVRTHV